MISLRRPTDAWKESLIHYAYCIPCQWFLLLWVSLPSLFFVHIVIPHWQEHEEAHAMREKNSVVRVSCVFSLFAHSILPSSSSCAQWQLCLCWQVCRRCELWEARQGWPLGAALEKLCGTIVSMSLKTYLVEKSLLLLGYFVWFRAWRSDCEEKSLEGGNGRRRSFCGCVVMATEMARWEGVLQAYCSGSNSHCRVTVSLCYSPSTGTLLVMPSYALPCSRFFSSIFCFCFLRLHSWQICIIFVVLVTIFLTTHASVQISVPLGHFLRGLRSSFVALWVRQ